MKNFILLLIIFTSVLFSQEKNTLKLTLKEAIKIALLKSDEKYITKINYDIAQSKYNQALSANYPKLDLELKLQRRDENTNLHIKNTIPKSWNKMMLFIESLEKTENITISKNIENNHNSNISKNIEDNHNSNISANYTMTQNLYGRDSSVLNLNLTYPLYTGGKISSIINQAQINTKLKKSDIKLTQNELIFNIKKLYYAYILTHNINKSIENSLEEMYIINDLTKKLYEGESLSVNKTDYLKTQIAIHFIKTNLINTKSSLDTIKLTFASILGMPNKKIIFIDKVFDMEEIYKTSIDLKTLIQNFKKHNINMKRINLKLDISKELIQESKAHYLPKILFYANSQKQYNSLNTGYNTKQNKKSWTVGILAKINLFNGFNSTNSLLEKKLYKKKLETYSKVLNKTNTLQIKKLFNKNKTSFKNIQTYKQIMKLAKENIDLSLKAYRIDMIKTRDLIETQLHKSKSEIMYYKAIYNYFLTNIQIERTMNKDIK